MDRLDRILSFRDRKSSESNRAVSSSVNQQTEELRVVFVLTIIVYVIKMKALIISTIVILTGILVFVLGYYLAVHNVPLFTHILNEVSKFYYYFLFSTNPPK
ncbi:hypothetical protein M0804_004773 [Polistes exclamans]|nr:hypothetical protein M0804_004773 [Polistes exclamans]